MSNEDFRVAAGANPAPNWTRCCKLRSNVARTDEPVLIDKPLQPFKGAAALKTNMGIPPSRSLKGDGGNWAVKFENASIHLGKSKNLVPKGRTALPNVLQGFSPHYQIC